MAGCRRTPSIIGATKKGARGGQNKTFLLQCNGSNFALINRYSPLCFYGYIFKEAQILRFSVNCLFCVYFCLYCLSFLFCLDVLSLCLSFLSSCISCLFCCVWLSVLLSVYCLSLLLLLPVCLFCLWNFFLFYSYW